MHCKQAPNQDIVLVVYWEIASDRFVIALFLFWGVLWFVNIKPCYKPHENSYWRVLFWGCLYCHIEQCFIEGVKVKWEIDAVMHAFVVCLWVWWAVVGGEVGTNACMPLCTRMCSCECVVGLCKCPGLLQDMWCTINNPLLQIENFTEVQWHML